METYIGSKRARQRKGLLAKSDSSSVDERDSDETRRRKYSLYKKKFMEGAEEVSKQGFDCQ